MRNGLQNRTNKTQKLKKWRNKATSAKSQQDPNVLFNLIGFFPEMLGRTLIYSQMFRVVTPRSNS